MTTEIQELSEKLAQIYGVDEVTVFAYKNSLGGYTSVYTLLAEDSGRISDLADDNNIDVISIRDASSNELYCFEASPESGLAFYEEFDNHPTKHDAARMARVRCLIAIKE